MRTVSFLAIVVLGCCHVLPAQISLQNESDVGNTYSLTYANAGYPFSIVNNNHTKYISFSRSFDENDIMSYPSCDLFIALPAGTRPEVTISEIQQQPVSNSDVANPPPQHAFTCSVKGYLWIGSNYCVHLTVQPFVYDEIRRQIDQIKSFKIGVNIPFQKTGLQSLSNTSINEAIDNKIAAAAWSSPRPESPSDQSGSWIDYTQTYVKLGVALDGIYRIGYSDLVSYGISPSSITPSQLKVFCKGKQIPIYVRVSNPLSFSQGDYIEFLGRRNYGSSLYRQSAGSDTAYYEYLDRYSDTTVYWLSWEGGVGLQVDTVTNTGGVPSDTIRYYDQLQHKEDNIYWVSVQSGGEVRMNNPNLLENETWIEGNFSVGTGTGVFSKSNIPFSITDLYPNKPARAFAKFVELSSDISIDAHDLALGIDNSPVRYDSGFINKYQSKVLSASFSSSSLTNGSNTVDIYSYATPNTINTVGRDWFELEYPRYLKVQSDSLSFSYNNLSSLKYSSFTITGLTTSALSLFRFNSVDSTILKITNYKVSSDTLSFTDSVSNGMTYFLVAENKIQPPTFFYKKKFVNLRSTTNKADYIAITHPYLQSVAADYVSFIHNTYGIDTKLVTINDICDEFNFGFFAPEPIREFLKTAGSVWQSPKPKYVFLIGKGTYDYYGNKSKYFGIPKVPNFVPPFGEPISDVWFVLWDSTGSMIPQMNIGRLPAVSVEELQAYFVKHQKFVTKGYDDWNKNYLFFSGGNFTDPNQIAQCKAVNDYVITNYVQPAPIGGTVGNFYKTADPVTNFGPYDAGFVQHKIEQGGVFISYIGHSGTQTWDNSITDITQLSNIRDRNPMISDFGCSTGKYAEPDVLSFSELAVNGINGQAIAYIGNSSLGFESTAFTFPKLFYKKLLIDTSAAIGDIHRLAKIDYLKQYGSSGSYGLFIETNELIGDPIVKLPIPTKPNVSFTNSTARLTPERPTEQDDSVIVGVNYFNYGNITGDSVNIKISVEYQGTVTTTILSKKLPLYQDSLLVAIPVENKAGQYTVTLTADPDHQYDELNENDNTFQYQFLVASSSIRNLLPAALINQTTLNIKFLNPTVEPANNQFFFDVSLNSGFSPLQTFQASYDSFFTIVHLDTSYYGKRIWIRSKLDNSTTQGLTFSPVVGPHESFLFGDSVAFSSLSKSSIAVFHNLLELDTSVTTFQAISGGFNDGNTAVITKDGENFIPENTLRGFHVCLFDRTTYQFKGYYFFDIQNGSSVSASFTTLLDTLTSATIVIIAIANDVSSDGSLFPASLKTAIKMYGSYYIDSVGVADSWAMIGIKGAAQGTVPERYAKRFNGRTIKTDTTMYIPNTSGSFETPLLGPVEGWDYAVVHFNSQTPEGIIIKIIGSNGVSKPDTLTSANLTDTLISLTGIDSKKYPFLQLKASFSRLSNQPSPSVSSIDVIYRSLPELGSNYQTVHATRTQDESPLTAGDSVNQGEKIGFSFQIYNAGGSVARNVKASIESQWENGIIEPIQSTMIDSIPSLNHKEITAIYNTSPGFGKRTVKIIIDPDSTIRELYKDNNVFAFPFTVKKKGTGNLLPDLFIDSNSVRLLTSAVTSNQDSIPVRIVYGNKGLPINDSVTIRVRQFYLGQNIRTWTIHRKFPISYDTILINVPILKMPGEHHLQVDLDPSGLITESSEDNNSVDYYFTVKTTDFTLIQPTPFSSSYISELVFLNPTDNTASGISTAEFNIDSIPDFSTATTALFPMGEFITTYPVGSLIHPKRYFWKIRVYNSGKEWTTGTFYLGESSGTFLGQEDSVGWSSDTFIHSGYSHNAGVGIVDSKYVILASSAGLNDGNDGSIEINGVNILSPIFGEGHNIAVLDTADLAIINLRRFDIPSVPRESDSLTDFITAIPSGMIVVDVVVGDGANNLLQSTRDALKTIGSARIDDLSFSDSWAIIGKKGTPAGSATETYSATGTGKAEAETLITIQENSGTVITPEFGPITATSGFSAVTDVPPGTSLKILLTGTKGKEHDTISLMDSGIGKRNNVFSTAQYDRGTLTFSFTKSGSVTPSVKSWSLPTYAPVELLVSSRTTAIDRQEVSAGETITFSTIVFNVSTAAAVNVTVSLLSNDGGTDRVLKSEEIASIPPLDSASFSYTYYSRNKQGNHAFTFIIDPLDSVFEVSKANNRISIPYRVIGDTTKPQVEITFDGSRVVNGDYVSFHPDILIRYTDTNPAVVLPSDTGNFKITLNGNRVLFTPGIADLISQSPGTATVRWKPSLEDGENDIQVFALDLSGNSSDTLTVFVNASSKFQILDVYNIPNPFARSTRFTFNVTGPVNPDQTFLKIFTVAGRLIQDITAPGKTGFNTIEWDGRDKDGDEVGNGVYLYKVIVKQGDRQVEAVSKLAKVR